LPAWRDAPAARNSTLGRPGTKAGKVTVGVIWQLGDKVYSGDRSRGEVVDLLPEYDVILIKWDDGDGGSITYPADASYLRKALPWE
jgi:hypothetical protein